MNDLVGKPTKKSTSVGRTVYKPKNGKAVTG